MGNASTVQPLGVQPLLEVIGDFQIVQVGKGRVGVAHVRQIFCCARFLPVLKVCWRKNWSMALGWMGNAHPDTGMPPVLEPRLPLRKAFQTPRSLRGSGRSRRLWRTQCTRPCRGEVDQ